MKGMSCLLGEYFKFVMTSWLFFRYFLIWKSQIAEVYYSPENLYSNPVNCLAENTRKDTG